MTVSLQQQCTDQEFKIQDDIMSQNVQMQSLRSGVWEYFKRDKVNQMAECLLCQAKLKACGGTTRRLHVHLQTKHQISVLKRPTSSTCSEVSEVEDCNDIHNEPKEKPVVTLDKYISRQEDFSMASALSRMIACDGMPFAPFSTSRDLRRVMAAAGIFC